MRHGIERQWYSHPTWLWFLLPLVPVLIGLSWLRRKYLSANAHRLPVPVVVIGNITVGGTGKTPLLITLVQHLQSQGYKPGVVSRGYGGGFKTANLAVTASTHANLCGDEPLLISQRCGCPVVVGRNRSLAGRRLIEEFGCNLILSDDGLQHYALARDLEIIVLDTSRGLGNGWRLPLGPLREGRSRLHEARWVLHNGGQGANSFQLRPKGWISVAKACFLPLLPAPWANTDKLFAIAGIGNPQRFFNSLAELGIEAQNRAFADHQSYSAEDFAFVGEQPLVMTAKDAVKCQHFARPNWWALEVMAVLSEPFLAEFSQQIYTLAQTKLQETA